MECVGEGKPTTEPGRSEELRVLAPELPLIPFVDVQHVASSLCDVFSPLQVRVRQYQIIPNIVFPSEVFQGCLYC